MKRILLDTSAYSALLRGHPQTLEIVQRAVEIHLNAVVLGELEAGLQRGSRLNENRRLLSELLSSPRVAVHPIDDETAVRYGEILNSLRQQGTPIPTNDIWIAASAMQYGLHLITTDEHFSHVKQVTSLVLPVTGT